MRLALAAIALVGVLVLGGCAAPQIRPEATPQWQASEKLKSWAQKYTIQKEMAKRYAGDEWDDFYEAQWSRAIALGEKKDRGLITDAEFNAQLHENAALFNGMRSQVTAAKDAADSASRAASRSFYCTRSGSGAFCY